jgi:hypothetical protein
MVFLLQMIRPSGFPTWQEALPWKMRSLNLLQVKEGLHNECNHPA